MRKVKSCVRTVDNIGYTLRDFEILCLSLMEQSRDTPAAEQLLDSTLEKLRRLLEVTRDAASEIED